MARTDVPTLRLRTPPAARTATALASVVALLTALPAVLAVAVQPFPLGALLVPGCALALLGASRLHDRRGRTELTVGLPLLLVGHVLMAASSRAPDAAFFLCLAVLGIAALVCSWLPATGRWLAASAPGHPGG